jgi:hypothetical protein
MGKIAPPPKRISIFGGSMAFTLSKIRLVSSGGIESKYVYLSIFSAPLM